MSIELLLERLEQVQHTGPRQFQARCPAHEDRTPSLNVKVAEDGIVLLHCFAGCSASEVVGAVGMCLRDLFPNDRRSKERIHELRIERMRVAYNHERLILQIARADLKKGLILSKEDQQRVNLALRRIRKYACLLNEEAA